MMPQKDAIRTNITETQIFNLVHNEDPQRCNANDDKTYRVIDNFIG